MKHFAVVALTAGLLTLALPAVAQPVTERSLAEAASSTIKNAAVAAWQTAQKVSAVALGLIGVDYKFGGNTPETGLDCSGLVRYVFQQVTGVVLPRTAKEMSRVGDTVALHELKPGDLVFFNTRHFAFSHVGIYLGNNRFVHAPSRGREVEIATIDRSFWQKRFSGARRLVGELPDLMPALVSDATAAPIETIAIAADAADIQP